MLHAAPLPSNREEQVRIRPFDEVVLCVSFGRHCLRTSSNGQVIADATISQATRFRFENRPGDERRLFLEAGFLYTLRGDTPGTYIRSNGGHIVADRGEAAARPVGPEATESAAGRYVHTGDSIQLRMGDGNRRWQATAADHLSGDILDGAATQRDATTFSIFLAHR